MSTKVATTMTRRLTSLAAHYGEVRSVYDVAPFYAPGPYEAWLTSACVQHMELCASHSLADLGGGSGGFATKLKQSAGARWLTVVEPSAAMLAGAEAEAQVNAAICSDALSWASSTEVPCGEASGTTPIRYERILLKEVVHHFDDSERPLVLQRLRENRLTDDGRVLIVTRPQRDIDYPLWDAAREVWASNQPSEARLADELRAAGFFDVATHLHTYPHVVATEEWCRLVKGRFWSTFSHFTEAELEEGCARIRADAAAAGAATGGGCEVLRFDDRLLFIEARVSPRAEAPPPRVEVPPPASIHLNAAGASPMAPHARAAMLSFLELEEAVGAYQAAAQRPHAAREALAALLGCEVGEIALFDSAQAAWARAFYSLRFAPSDRILCFAHEYAGNAVAFLQVAKRTGAQIQLLPMRTDGVVDVGALEAVLAAPAPAPCSPNAVAAGAGRRTLVALTHINMDSSIVQPAAEVGALCRAHGAVYLLDACQSVGQMPVDLETLGCDFACGTGRKWLRAPRGTGFLYARRSALDAAVDPASTSLFGEPPLLDHSGAAWSAPETYTLLPDARRFEMWEADEAARHGLAAAAEQCLRIGPAAIHHRASALAARLRAGLAAMPGCVVRDAPPSFDVTAARALGAERCAIVTLEAESAHGVPAATLRDALAARGVVGSVASTHHSFDPSDRARPPTLRLSPSFYNTEQDIDAALGIIAEELARLGGAGPRVE